MNACWMMLYISLPIPMPIVAFAGVHLMLATCFFWMFAGPRSFDTMSASICKPSNFLRKPALAPMMSSAKRPPVSFVHPAFFSSPLTNRALSQVRDGCQFVGPAAKYARQYLSIAMVMVHRYLAVGDPLRRYPVIAQPEALEVESGPPLLPALKDLDLVNTPMLEPRWTSYWRTLTDQSLARLRRPQI